MRFRTPQTQVTVPHMSDDDLARVRALLGRIGGPHVSWGADSFLDVWLAEVRLEADRRAAQRIMVATWALVAATAVLALATVGLIIATLQA